MPRRKPHTDAWKKRHPRPSHSRLYNRAFLRRTLRLLKGDYMTNDERSNG
jgi:hypothetical protein